MEELPSNNSDDVVSSGARSRRRRRIGLGALLVVVALGVTHSRGWATQPLRLEDGRVFHVLNFDRHLSVTLTPDGERKTEHMFWVRYYATSNDAEAMRAEARLLAPALFPIADSLGYDILRLTPSRPIFTRLLPIGVVSREVRFERDADGEWMEPAR